MKTVTKISLALVLFVSLKTAAQENGSPKNFPEVFAGVEWNTISGLTGVSYERYVFQKDQWVFGMKATHAFTYYLSNMALLSSGSGEKAFFNSLTATTHKFFNENNRGFFLCSELGLGLKNYKYYENEWSKLFAAFEAGLGLQFRVGDKLAIRWTNTLTFAGNGGITMTKLSVGF